MKLEKLNEEKKKNKITFLLKGTDEVFTNTVRRLIIEEVPSMAVEDLEIKENNSALYDEMIGLRLGLSPIKTDLKSYELKENCKCEAKGCARCELKITLKASKKGYVHAGNAESTDPKCTFVHENMPIVKLLSKQKIDISMTAVLGKGKEHTKWSPGLGFFKHEAILKIGKVKDPIKVVESCSDGVFNIKNKKIEINPEKVYESKLLDYYASLDEGITVEYTDNFIFNLESWGQLSCKDILSKSAEILADKTEEMEKLIS
jgi:DNA-directed RNA polymerase subunit D